jgi:hypothetical protein
VQSLLPEAKYFPSGEYATVQTLLLCPLKHVIYFFVSVLHNLIVLSELLDAKYLPSGEKATELTQS